jgi:GGDEF domain-containing protein
MHTFRGFLRNGKLTTAELAQSLHAMLTGVTRYTFGGNDQELSTFREGMLALASNIHEQASPAELEASVTHALNLLRDYNERNLRFNIAHTTELKAVMRTMTETITYLSESRTRSVHQLQFMERELEQASEIDDVRLLRSRLITCLDLVREETVRLQSESQARSHEVRQQIDRSAKADEPVERFGAMDIVTGLPARRSAERALTGALSDGVEHAIAVFVVKRLSAINAKYGRGVGDEVMLRVANHFVQHLSPATFLYRWSGPALVALIAMPAAKEDIRRSWAKAAAAKQEVNLEVKQRHVFVIVETNMSFQLGSASASPEELFQKLDQFVADQADSVAEEVSLPN